MRKSAYIAITIPGVLGGFVYYGASKLVVRALIDDPLDAFAVHGACGFWGVVAVGLFASPDYGYNAEGAAGLFYGGDKAGVLLGVQLCGLVAEIAWVGLLSSVLFFALKAARLLRVDLSTEETGMDVSKHGGGAYIRDDGGAAMKDSRTPTVEIWENGDARSGTSGTPAVTPTPATTTAQAA